MRYSLKLALVGCAMTAGLAGSASAADMAVKAPVLAAQGAPWLDIFGGVAVDRSGWFADAGFVAAFSKDLTKSGWLLRARGGGGHYSYNVAPGVAQGVDYQVGELMVGYQAFINQTRISLYLGANVENHNNPDPLATITGTKWGVKGQGEIFTSLSPNMYALLMGSYSTAFNSYFAMGKLGYKVTNNVSIGPEVAALGNDRFDAVRAGAFVGFDVTKSTMVILSGGYSWDERRNALNDNSGGYGTLHVRSLF